LPLSEFRKWGSTGRALAVALTDYEASLCDGCGQPVHLSMDPENEGHWVAPLPMRCHACTVIAHRVKDYEKADAPDALKFHAELHGATRPAQ
jgi:uncharacterized cysteine cluster protein YcgN (CxxCxxCC family)